MGPLGHEAIQHMFDQPGLPDACLPRYHHRAPAALLNLTPQSTNITVSGRRSASRAGVAFEMASPVRCICRCRTAWRKRLRSPIVNPSSRISCSVRSPSWSNVMPFSRNASMRFVRPIDLSHPSMPPTVERDYQPNIARFVTTLCCIARRRPRRPEKSVGINPGSVESIRPYSAVTVTRLLSSRQVGRQSA
jgi:hypothetical protein